MWTFSFPRVSAAFTAWLKNRPYLYLLSLSPKVLPVMKMEGDKICQTELMFIDLTILVNFSPICQSEISLAGLTNFAIFITACISGNRNWLGGSSIKKRKKERKEKVRVKWKEINQGYCQGWVEWCCFVRTIFPGTPLWSSFPSTVFDVSLPPSTPGNEIFLFSRLFSLLFCIHKLHLTASF